MTPTDVRPALKRLKLCGMLATMDIRLQEADTQHLGYLEFLERLRGDALERREQRTLERHVAAARFEQVTTLMTVDWTDNPEIPAAPLRDRGTCAFLRRHESVILAGAVGLGKSHLAQALGYAACQQGYHVADRKAPALLADLSGGHADGTYERRLRAYFQPDLLIVDDFGLREFTPQQSEDLYELVCQRDQHKSWILVSNRLPQDWYPLFPNPVLAEGILDRLVNTSYHIVLQGKSYRPRRRPGVTASDLV
jgi:DNA replication protein DnaC